jgi:hypothetical protein
MRLRPWVLLLVATLSCLVAATTVASAAAYTYDAPVLKRADAFPNEAGATASRHIADRLERSASPVIEVHGVSTTSSVSVVATKAGSGNPHGLGVADPPSRVAGPWTEDDLMRGAMGKPPKSLGSPELHHADQMPGAGIHEIDPVTHRLPGNHANKYNQGVTDAMRTADRQLHWWYRAQEMGGREVLGPEAFYD